MKQFYETYRNSTIVSSAMTQLELHDIRETIIAKITWTHNLTLISRTKSEEEWLFYIHQNTKKSKVSPKFRRSPPLV